MSRSVDPTDPRLHYPATSRNRDAILEVLRQHLPASGVALEVASGSGQHAAFFAEHLPGWTWQPSDLDPEVLSSIAAWTSGLANVRAPVALDVLQEPWPLAGGERFDVVFNANMIHISPWACCLGLLCGAAEHLEPGGLLILYGPFKLAGEHTAPSNQAFDDSLRARDPSWGVRDLDAVRDAASPLCLTLEHQIEMPANNQTVVFRR